MILENASGKIKPTVGYIMIMKNTLDIFPMIILAIKKNKLE